VGTNIEPILLLINEIFFLFPHYFPKLSKTAIFCNKKEANQLRKASNQERINQETISIRMHIFLNKTNDNLLHKY
jgi:hypothetical protein